jgi:glutaredoxin-related protein
MHGSKAYLEQLANKLLIQVELCNTNFIFKGNQNILISQLKKRELNFEERNILSKNFNIKTFLEIVESSKIKIGSKN